MPSADKRQRKKENARAAREAREAELKRRRRIRTIRNAAIAGGIFVAAVVILTIVGGNDKKKATTPTTTTTVAYPAGCAATVPKTSAKPSNLKAPAMKIDPAKTYTATLSTSCGDVTIALDAKHAPKSVNNFVSLARQGFFDGLTWHRVAPPIVQSGNPVVGGDGDPGYHTTVELPTDGKYPAGAVAWAKKGPEPDGTAGSQFFMTTADDSAIGNHYGYIGKISAGMANVQKMELLVPSSGDGPPSRPLYILKATITEK